MKPVDSFLPLFALLLVLLQRAHMDRCGLLVVFLAVVSAVGVAMVTVHFPARLAADIERRLRDFEIQDLVRRYREIADLIARWPSLELRLLMHQGHVLPCVELGILVAGLPQRYLRRSTRLGGAGGGRQLVLIAGSELLLRVFVKLEQVLMDFHRLLNLKLFVPLHLGRELLLLVFHELSDSLLLQHWAAGHALMGFVDGYLLLGRSGEPIL